MVGGTPKPFPCTHEGCSMTFTNEDHLNVHQKKHVMDLNLNLGTKPNSLVGKFLILHMDGCIVIDCSVFS